MVNIKPRLLLAMALLLAGLAFTAVSLAAPADSGETVVPSLVAANAFPNLAFQLPAAIASAGDERLFIVEQAGRIWAVEGSGPGATKTLFLDIADGVQTGCENGLLGLAFHPQYAQNGYFYVNYIARENLDTRISRFQATADANVADPESEQILLEVEQPYCNHNGGDLHFDPQGMLVIALGDGGSGGDPGNRSQNPQELLGKLLRIDVDHSANGKNYAIPADNPFAGPDDTLDEIWALGMRNPWRFSFDRLTGDLYVGDVGQDSWEEVDFVPAAEAGGQNFGWRLKEGFACFNPAQECDPGGLTDPVFVYGHDEGCAVTGGFVYRGDKLGALSGAYVYADFCTGQVYALSQGAHGWQSRPLLQAEAPVVAFGEDSQGELYLAARDSGRIYRLGYAEMLPVILR